LAQTGSYLAEMIRVNVPYYQGNRGSLDYSVKMGPDVVSGVGSVSPLPRIDNTNQECPRDESSGE
jgi:hypothetical protein